MAPVRVLRELRLPVETGELKDHDAKRYENWQQHIAETTVKSHLNNIFRKAKVRSRFELARELGSDTRAWLGARAGSIRFWGRRIAQDSRSRGPLGSRPAYYGGEFG